MSVFIRNAITALFVAAFFVSPARAACEQCTPEEKAFVKACGDDQQQKGLPQADIEKACVCALELGRKNLTPEQFKVGLAIAGGDKQTAAQIVEKNGQEWAKSTAQAMTQLGVTETKVCGTK